MSEQPRVKRSRRVTRTTTITASRFQQLQPDSYGVVHLEGISTQEELDEILVHVRNSNTSEIVEESKSAITACWLKLNRVEEFSILPFALERGFQFHHANGFEAVLGLWLRSNEPNSLPKGSSHTIGVGAMVVDVAEKKVLVIKEKVGPAKGKWKLVTGLVDVGEYVSDAAIREVREETSLQSELKVHEVIAMREMHNHVFGLSNMYFVCLLQADNHASNGPLIPCPRELEDAKWVTLEEFKTFEYYAKGTLYQEISRVSAHAATKIIEGNHELGEQHHLRDALVHRRVPVDPKGTRVESLWAISADD